LIFCFVGCKTHTGHALMGGGTHKEKFLGWLKCLTRRSEARPRD